MQESGASAGFRRLTLMSLLAGACPLIPVPFVDDWCLKLVRRRTVSDLLRRSGLITGGGSGGGSGGSSVIVRRLAGERDEQRGCIAGTLGLAVGAVFYLVGKLFKKLVFVLTLRDCVRCASETFGEGYLLRHAVAGGAAERSLAASEAGAVELRRLIEAALAGAGSGPLRRVVRGVLAGSWGELARGAGLLRRTLAGRRGRKRDGEEDAVPVEVEEGVLGGLVDRLTAALWMEEEYRRRLEGHFDALYYHSPSADRRSVERSGNGSRA